MNAVLARIRQHAARQPHAAALADETGRMDYGQLADTVGRLADSLGAERIGLLVDNGMPWACLDLAVLHRGAVCIPMPTFFSNEQLRHLIDDADLDLIVTDQPGRVAILPVDAPAGVLELAGRRLSLFRRRPRRIGNVLPAGTAKVTYTSGSTGQPKGVCLSVETLAAITDSLCQAVAADAADRSLSLLPLSTLLENIAGLYAPLWAGALAQVPSLTSCGLSGSSGLDVARLFQALGEARPTTLVLVPQLLKGLVGGIAAGLPAPGSLRFVAVGGAPLADALLTQARRCGLPVYQGFGLSETGSVVSLNLPGADRPGSVGRPLPHARVRIAADGEVVVGGQLLLGYLGEPGTGRGDEWHTGDLGHIDPDGYLHLTGRKKTAFATAFGRNVAPEWLEGALTALPQVAQAAVFGEGRPFNVAVLVPRPDVTPQALSQALSTANEQLPDYARVSRWILAEQPFSPGNGLANGAGCIQRDAVGRRYRQHIEQLYEEDHAVL